MRRRTWSASGRRRLSDRYLPGVMPESQFVDHPSGERRHREAGAGDEHNRVDVAFGHTGRRQCLPHHWRDAHLGLTDMKLVARFETGNDAANAVTAPSPTSDRSYSYLTTRAFPGVDLAQYNDPRDQQRDDRSPRWCSTPHRHEAVVWQRLH